MSSRQSRRAGVKTLNGHGHGHIGLKKPSCFNPDKVKFFTLEKARAKAEEYGQTFYGCGNHWHLTSKKNWKPRVN